MSGKTIRLLQIVYGADFKRLQLTADQLKDEISKVNTKNLRDPRGQQDFADKIQPLVTKALKLAKYVDERGDDQDSPYSRDLLKNAAANLRERAKEVIESGNAALADPERASAVDDALGRLRGAIGDAQKLADETHPTGADTKMGKLAPLLERAIKAVEAVPPAVKAGPERYQPAEKQVKDDVGAVVRALKANPKANRDAAKIDDDLLKQILAARKALQSPGASQKELDDATQNLLNALKGLRKYDGGPTEVAPEDLHDFQKALQNLKKTLGPATYPKADDQSKDAYERLMDNLNGTRKAVADKDPELGTHNLKQMWNNGKDLSDKITDAGKKLPSLPRYQRDQQVAKDIVEDLIPKVIRKGKPAMANPKDEKAGDDLLDALRRLRRAMGRLEPNDEKDMRDNWNELLKNLRKVRQDAERGQPIDEGLAAIQQALRNLRNAAERRAQQHPENPEAIRGPMRELDSLGQDFVRQAKGKDLSGMDTTVPKMEDAWRRLDRAANASKVGAVQDLENALDDVMAAIDLSDPTRLAPSARDALQKLDTLEKLVENLDDPNAKRIGQRALGLVRPGVRDFIEAGREAVKNPDDRTWVDKSADILHRLKAPLADLKEALDPTAKDRIAEGAGAAVKKAMEELRLANLSGDPERIRKALENLRQALDRYNGIVNGQVEEIPDPQRKNVLDKEAQEVKEFLGDVRRADPTSSREIEDLLDRTPTTVDSYLTAMRRNEKDDAIRAAAQTDSLNAAMGSLDQDNLDLGDLLGTAGQLSSLMRGMVKNTAPLAQELGTNEQNLTDAAKAAIALDRTIRRIQGIEDEPEVQEVQSLPPPPAPAAPVSTISDDIFENVSNPTNVEDIMSAVAYEVHMKAKAVSEAGDNIAQALAKLAKAARSGDKQGMLLASREVAAFIVTFCKELTDFSQRIPGKNTHEKREADRLIRSATALRTFGTQLKILCSVKAASIEQNRDNDESLATLTRTLGDVLTQGLTGITTVQQTILRK